MSILFVSVTTYSSLQCRRWPRHQKGKQVSLTVLHRYRTLPHFWFLSAKEAHGGTHPAGGCEAIMLYQREIVSTEPHPSATPQRRKAVRLAVRTMVQAKQVPAVSTFYAAVVEEAHGRPSDIVDNIDQSFHCKLNVSIKQRPPALAQCCHLTAAIQTER